MRVTAGSLQLEGVLLANGSGSSSGSGSGGGVYVAVNTLSGSGSIQAKGGSSTYGYGGGGGGRVAVYAGDWSGFNVGHHGAWGNGTAGGAGTVYLKRSGDAVGTLVIDNSLSGGAAWTPLGVPGTNDMVIPDVVVIRGSKTMVSAEHSGLVLHFLSPVIVTNAAYVSMPGSSLDLQAAPVISGGGRVEVSGGFFVSVPLDLANGGQVSSERVGNLVGAGDRFGQHVSG